MVMLPDTPVTRILRGAPADREALSEDDRRRIADAVATAERKTSAEFVVVIETDPCEESDATIALVSAGFLAIASAAPLSLLALSLHAIVVAQAMIFAVLAALASSSRVRRLLRIDRLPSVTAHEAAERVFEDLALGRTQERTAVLIHVALADRRVEVIAEEGVHEAVSPRTWEEIVSAMTASARVGRLADGIVAAVARCGEALADILPPEPGLGDELPNEPIVR